MSLKAPEGSNLKKAAAWESIVASIILFVMICYKMVQTYIGKMPSLYFEPLTKYVGYIMGENTMVHIGLYFILFALVFSSSIMGYFYEDNN